MSLLGRRDPLERSRSGTEAFLRIYGRAPEFAVRAPGRVNLIGEHTDYNGGLVLPCAIDLDTTIWAAARDDREIRAVSLEFDGEAAFQFGGSPGTSGTAAVQMGSRASSWGAYLAGPIFALAEAEARSGTPLPLANCRGYDAVISSELPPGAGLSSSAALGLAATWTFSYANELDSELDARGLAELAWHGERDYVGTECGVLDFYASALGREGKALRIDCLDRSIREIDFPEEIEILVAHSGVTRSVASSRYRERVAECRRAVEQARGAGLCAPDTNTLRALGAVDSDVLRRHLDPIAFLRARHVLEENVRVDRFAAALEGRRFEEAGFELRDGMRSLRSNYEASVPELDLLCEAGDEAEGCYGSRLTGAGWGGCSIHLIETGAGPDVAAHIQASFAGSIGRTPPMWRVRACQGAGAWLSGVSD